MRMSMRWCTPAVVVAMVGLAQAAGAQDRGDQVSRSAADVQRTESYGQPGERDQGYYGGNQYGQGQFTQGQYQGDYDRQSQRAYGDQFGRQDQQFGQGQQYGQRQQFGQGQQYGQGGQQYGQGGQQYGQGQQFGQRDQREGDRPAGLGVVLRETGDRGVQVIEVHQGSPAEEAGLRPGDEIVAINGRQTNSVQELQSRVIQQDPGERVEIVALRNGQQQRFNARLETRRGALNQQQRFASQGGQYQQRGQQQRGQGQQAQARLASLERQLQQLLREVRMLRNQSDRPAAPQMTQDYPQPPRQAQRQQSDRFGQTGQQWQDNQQWQDGQQQWQDDRSWQDGSQQQFRGQMDDQDYDNGGSDDFDF